MAAPSPPTPWKARTHASSTSTSSQSSAHRATQQASEPEPPPEIKPGAQAMAAAAAPAGNGEVRVEKVDRLGFVYNAVTRPPRPATVVMKKKLPPAADVAISRTDSGTKLTTGVATPDDIYLYLAKKKWEFLHGE